MSENAKHIAELFVRARIKELLPFPYECSCFGCSAELEEAGFAIEIVLGEGAEFSEEKQPARLCLELCPRCAKKAVVHATREGSEE